MAIHHTCRALQDGAAHRTGTRGVYDADIALESHPDDNICFHVYFLDNCETDFLGYDASGDVMRDPAVNFQDASNAHAPPTNSAVGHHYSNPILTANGMVALVLRYTYLAAVR